MRGPIAILPALTFIASTDEFTVGDLPRLTNDAKRTRSPPTQGRHLADH